jgi:hypothetical protein
MQAVAQLAEEAQVYLDVKSFQIINIVGAVTIGATINCEAFAKTHNNEVQYDRSSFVGMVRTNAEMRGRGRGRGRGRDHSLEWCVVLLSADVASQRCSVMCGGLQHWSNQRAWSEESMSFIERVFEANTRVIEVQ